MSSAGRAKLAVEYRAVSALIPYARNARTHSDAQVAEIAASIREFGFTNPILVDGDNGIIAGHGRLLAARKLGMTEVPVIELAGMTEAQKRAYVIADNRLALNAGWNTELLALEFSDLDALGFDLSRWRARSSRHQHASARPPLVLRDRAAEPQRVHSTCRGPG
jgi:ParB-like chromosome segregation protein Spo0J